MTIFAQFNVAINKAALELDEVKAKNEDLEDFLKITLRDFKRMHEDFETIYTKQAKILTKEMSP